MSSNIVIAAEHPSMGKNNMLTFAGVLQKYFIVIDDSGQNVGISKRWNENTKKAYKSDYENILLPLMKELLGERKPICLYSEEDIDLVLSVLKKKRHLADSRIEHFYYLIKIVYMAGVEHGLYDNSLMWINTDDVEKIDLTEESERVRVMTRMRKSLSVEEELRIVKWFLKLDPVEADGEEVGLLLMYFMGLRNNEACGADFENFHELNGHKGVMVFDMLKSTKKGNNQLKAGGKTSNAPRTLIVLKPLADFLQKRCEALENMIAEENLRLPVGYNNKLQLPVVCKGKDYLRRADSNSLSKAGKALFDRIKIDKSEMLVMENILRGSEFRDVVSDEKDPTTYLLRRNCATHLYNLGFSFSELQYWMGHEIDDPDESRNSFADSDALALINEKIQNHPICILINYYIKKGRHEIEDDSILCFSTGKMIFRGCKNNYILNIEAQEPDQKLEIYINTLNQMENFASKILITSEKEIKKNTVNTVDIQKKIYVDIAEDAGRR